VHHIHSELKADIESQWHSRETQAGVDHLSMDQLQQLFVKHRSGEVTFFCDLGICIVCL